MNRGRSGRIGDVALSEVIGFILILGILVAALAIYTVYFVPVSGREAEIAHADYIEEQFTDYKLTLDALWTSRLINVNSPVPVLNVTPIISSTSLSLTTGGNTLPGGLSFPLFSPIPSTGILVTNKTGDTFDIDSSSYHGSLGDTGEFPLDITALEYRSNNHYWIQQGYSYQLGGVFLTQNEGMINRISPLISFVNSANKSIVVNIVPVQILGNRSYSNNNPVRIDTRQKIVAPYNIAANQYVSNAWVNLSFTSADSGRAGTWLNLFKDIAVREQLESSAYTTGSVYDAGSKRTTVYINITGSDPDPIRKDISLYVQRAEFEITFNSLVSGLT
jgi:hypothetical protein